MTGLKLPFSTLQGLTLVSVTNQDDEFLEFVTTDGRVYQLRHEQDCCEYVSIEDICGDLADLVGSPILLAEEVTHGVGVQPEGVTPPVLEREIDIFEWTFYKLATINGRVTVRWYGASEGYSVAVDFVQVR